MFLRMLCGIGLLFTVFPAGFAVAQETPQQARPRLKDEKPLGVRQELTVGKLFIPDSLKDRKTLPLFVHFHGAPWLPEAAAAKLGKAAVVAVQLGSGSSAYEKPFQDPQVFARLIDEARQKSGITFSPIGLTAWSAGYGSVRAILRQPDNARQIQFVVLMDGLHAGYVDPTAQEKQLVATNLDVFVDYAKHAVEKKRQMIVTHSRIVPGTYASTTETADYLLRAVQVEREMATGTGPGGLRRTSSARAGNLRIYGFTGETAPDHVDHLHLLPEWLSEIDWTEP